MRAFIIFCLVAVAYADKLGYNYQPVEHSDAGLSFAPGAGVSGGNLGSSFNVDPGFNGAGEQSFSNIAPQGDFGGSIQDAPSFAPEAEFEKEFFTYTADDDDFNDPAVNNQYADAVKQGLRVVFIKGPENNGLENAALTLAKHAADQNTDIYVLNKQADLSGLANKLNNINKNNNNKPEVHFVKYRTPEDAANAQNAIQGQYDSLGGRSQSFDGGVAPVLNFASQAPGSTPTSSYIPPAAGPSASYLPANIFRF